MKTKTFTLFSQTGKLNLREGLFIFMAVMFSLLSSNFSFGQTSILSVTDDAYENRNNNYINSTFERETEIRNVQQAGLNFTGYIKLNLQNHASAISVKFHIDPAINTIPNTIQVVQPAGIHNDVFNPSIGYTLQPTDEIILKVINFRPGADILRIVEVVTINECLTPYGNQNLSTFGASLAATGASDPVPAPSAFQTINGGTFSQQLNQGEIPVHEAFDLVGYNANQTEPTQVPMISPSDFYCTGNNNFRHLSFSLRRSSLDQYVNATFWDLDLKFSNDYVSFTIDRNSIVINKFKENSSGGSPILVQSYPVSAQEDNEDPDWGFPNAKTQRYFDITSADCVPGGKFRSLQYSIGDLKPDEYLVIEYDLYNCCTSETNFEGLRQTERAVYFTFTDDCGTRRTHDVGYNSNYYNNFRGVIINGDVSSAPAALMGPHATKPFPDIGNFVIDNPLHNNGYQYWGVYGGFGAVFNPMEAELVIRITSGANLRYTAFNNSGGTITTIAGTYPHSTNPAPFSYYSHTQFIHKNDPSIRWQPVSAAGTVSFNGDKEIREFRFRLVDLPELNTPLNSQNVFDQFFFKMAEMQLVFSLEGNCSPLEDGNWSVDYLMNTDATCSQCLQSIERVSESVIVNCPGCKVPGAIARGRTERAIFGPYDFDNNGIPDAGETEASTHTLQEVITRNGLNTDPTDDIQTNVASAGDPIKITSTIVMTVPSDCNIPQHGSDRTACRDYELQYKYTYLQVKVPTAGSSPRKSYFDNQISNLNIAYTSSGTGLTYTIPGGNVEYHFYDQQSSEDIFYFKIEIADVPGFSSSDYFRSSDRFEISFDTRLEHNPTERKLLEISYLAYFTKAEEVYGSAFIAAHPDLFNRSYADCQTAETRGMDPPVCNTETLQMICEFDQSFLVVIPIATTFADIGYTGFSEDKSCVKTVRSNSTGYYAADRSNFGNPTGYSGINIYKNEFRRAPVIQSANIAVPAGYYLEKFQISSHNYATNNGHNLIIDQAALSPANQALNLATTTDRVLTIDLSSFHTISSTLIDDEQRIYYADESSQPGSIYISMIPDCRYLINNTIESTDMGNVVINGNTIYSTFIMDNQYVGSTGPGEFRIGGSRFTKTPEFSSNPFTFEKIGAVGNNFPIQKNKNFHNHIKIHTPLPVDPKESYSGNVFIGIDPVEITKYFSSFQVYAGSATPSGTPIIDWKADGSANTVVGQFNNLPYWWGRYTDLHVVGELNLAECANLDAAPYSLIYGIHCNTAEITHANILDLNFLCNRWVEDVVLDLDDVDMLINMNANPGQPILTDSRITHEAIFTASRSEITGLEINLTNSPVSDFENIAVSIFKNTGGANDQSIVLTQGTHYTLTFPSVGTAKIQITDFPNNTYFESANSLHDYYNEVRLTFDVVNTDCQVTSIQTLVEGIATPFYSNNCPIIRNGQHTAPLNNGERPVVTLLDPGQVCLGADMVLVLTGGDPAYTYTWYKDNQIISDPDFVNSSDHSSIRITIDDILDHTYKVNVVNGACSVTSNIVTLSVDPVLTVDAGPDQTICFGSSANLSASGATDYSWSPSTGLNNVSVANPTATPSGTVTYTVTGTTSGYCPDTDDVTVSVRSVAVGISSDRPTFLVPGCNNEVILTATGGPFVSYQWHLNEGSGYQPVSGATSSSHTATVAGYYRVDVTDDFGCIGSAYVNVEDGITLSGDEEVCEGEEPILNVNIAGVLGPYQIQTIFDGFLPGPPKQARYHGILVFEVTNPTVQACTLTTANLDVDVHPLPDPFTIDVIGDTYICTAAGETVDLVATPSSTYPVGDPAWSYAWSTGETSSLTLNDVSASGSYSITVMDNNGCQATSNAIIIVAPGVYISQHCRPDNSVILMANVNVPADNYIWRDASDNVLGNDQTLVVNSNGIYSVEIPGIGCYVYNTTQVCIQATDGTDLVNNGDFEDGYRTCPLPYSVITDQDNCRTANVPSGAWPGSYMITQGVSDLNGGLWESTGGFVKSGINEYNFLLVDGEVSPAAVKVWSQENVQVDACGTYTFKALIDNIIKNEAEVPVVWLTVNGNRISGKTRYPNNQPNWIQLSGDWYSNGASSVDLAIYLEKGGWVGRDIGVDEIQFYKKGCTTDPGFRGIDIVASVGTNKYICPGSSVQIGANIPDPTYTYNWTASGGFSSSDPNPTVSPTATTTYTLTVTDGAGNEYTDDVTVYITPTTFTLNAGSDVSICENGSVQLQASGSPSGYTWTPSAGLSATDIADPIASPSETTVYTVSADDQSSGCVASDQVTVTVNPPPATPVVSAGLWCSGQTATIAIQHEAGLTPVVISSPFTQIYTYLSIPGGTNVMGQVGTVSGDIVAGVASAEGCTTLVTIPQNVYPSISSVNITATPQQVCAGSPSQLDATVTGGTTPFTYEWEAIGPDPFTSTEEDVTVNPTAYTVYNLNVTDANGCFGSSYVLHNPTPVPSTPVITASGSTSFCDGGSVTLSTDPGLFYQWNLNGTPIAGATNNTYVADASGDYTVTTWLSASCPVTSAVTTVTENAIPPTAGLTVSATTVCYNGTVNVGVGYPYPLSPLTLSYTRPAGTTVLGGGGGPGGFGETVRLTQSGNFEVRIISPQGCSSLVTVPVTVEPVPSTPVITASGALTFCEGGRVTLSTDQVAGLNYQWNLDGAAIAGATGNSLVVNASGNYTVSTWYVPACSLTSLVTSVTVNPVPPTPGLTVTPTQVCQNGSVSTGVTYPPAGHTYTYTMPAGSTVLGAGGGPTGFGQGVRMTQTGAFTLLYTNSTTGCTSLRSITVTVDPVPPTPVITGPSSFCDGGSATLSTTLVSGASYQWKLNGTAIPGATTNSYVANGSGNYTVTTWFTSGCPVTSAVKGITVNPLPPTPGLSVTPTQVCQNGTVSTGVTYPPAGHTYTYTRPAGSTVLGGGGGSGGFGEGVRLTQTGAFTLLYTNSTTGCTSFSSITVTVDPVPPTPVIAGPTNFCDGGSATLSTTLVSGASYQWKLNGTAISGATTNSYVADGSGNYTLTTWFTSGCPVTSAVKTVTENPFPPTPVMTVTPTTVCANGTVSVGVTYPPSPNTYTYTRPAGSTVLGGGGGSGGFGEGVRMTISGDFVLTYNSPQGCTTETRIPVTVNSGCKQGVYTEEEEAAVDSAWVASIYPNPSMDEANLVMRNAKSEFVKVEVIDLNGVTVRVYESVNPTELFTFGADLRSGVYLIRILDGKTYHLLKFVKQE